MRFRENVFWFGETDAPLREGEELVVDCFAGGGGASLGMERAIGRQVDVAIDHDKPAIAMHLANHPETHHWCENLWDVDPEEVADGRPIGLAWFSPDCTHFSKAKGGKPRDKRIRALAWIVVRWAARVRPRVICLENVEEFVTWGPLKRGQPIAERKGETFARFCRQLRELGYELQRRTLAACDYGSPTTRKRLFLVARCDGEPIVWPEPTHGSPKVIAKALKRGPCNLKRWRTAAEIIDWSLPCPSIFLSPEEAKHIGCRRPLAQKTLARIAEGIRRYVIETREPFIVRAPVPTATTENRFAMVSAFLAQHFGGMVGVPASSPFPTITARGTQNQLVAATLIKNGHGDKQAFEAREPLRTVVSQGTHHAEVRAFLMRYYSLGGQWSPLDRPVPTLTARDRLALGIVLVDGEPWQIVDIGMRMLTPRELFRAQGFPDSYKIDVGLNGRPASKADQVGRCGNSVCPQFVEALVRANFAPQKFQPIASSLQPQD